MATQVFFRGDTNSFGSPGMHTGDNLTKRDGSGGSGWYTQLLSTTRGSANQVRAVSTVDGPTTGLEIQDSGIPFQWFTMPLAADTTISGTITLNLWAYESAMQANVAINAVIEQFDSKGAYVQTIAQTARVTELGTTNAAVNFTVTPTSTNLKEGDRIRVRVYADDAGTMVAGYLANFSYNGPTPAAAGDSYISFTETFSFHLTDPTGTTLYLTDTAAADIGAGVEKEMWTSRGGGVATAVRNTATGWTAPLQWTDSAGGTAIEWYSRPLKAFTLSGLVKVKPNIGCSNTASQAGFRVELAVTNRDGTNAVVWASQCIMNQTTIEGISSITTGQLAASEMPYGSWIAGDSLAVTEGQRLRLRVYLDDMSSLPVVSGYTATIWYNGTSPAGTGDSLIVLPQTIEEFVDKFPRSLIIPSNQAVRRAANW